MILASVSTTSGQSWSRPAQLLRSLAGSTSGSSPRGALVVESSAEMHDPDVRVGGKHPGRKSGSEAVLDRTHVGEHRHCRGDPGRAALSPDILPS
ncbi:MAG: hypothetical protein ACRDJG_06730, partial [Actinomycetota bacterium]